VLREAVELLERVLVEEGEDALHRGLLAARVLLVDGGLATRHGFLAAPGEIDGLACRGSPVRAVLVDGCRAHRSS